MIKSEIMPSFANISNISALPHGHKAIGLHYATFIARSLHLQYYTNFLPAREDGQKIKAMQSQLTTDWSASN